MRNPDLTDATDDFDFVLDKSARFAFQRLNFQMLDGHEDGDFSQRTDRWVSNYMEAQVPEHLDEFGVGFEGPYELDPWDPDSDDDGLTDGQEIYGVTEVIPERGGRVPMGPTVIEDDEHTFNTSPVDPDSDDDGFWDGWVGVYGVGYSENVVLYADNLRSGNGIEGDEIVDEQIGVHEVTSDPKTSSETSTSLPGRNGQYHSNVHVGELQWETNPRDPNDEPDTDLTVEVDWLDGYNPTKMKTPTGDSVLDLTRRNYLLYDIELDFQPDESITRKDLKSTCRLRTNLWAPGVAPKYHCVEPDSFNVWETDLVEDEFHQNDQALHLFWTNEYGSDFPEYRPHDSFIPSGVSGMEGHTGSPTQVDFIENGFGTPHGAIMFDDTMSSTPQKHRVLMEEIGHGLSIGWADDKFLEIGECYSGGFCYPQWVGGNDETPELVSKYGDPIWPVMGAAFYIDTIEHRTAFSLEEISTIDLKDIPSVDD